MTDHHAVRSTEEMISEFITGTCQLLPKSYTPTSYHMHDLMWSRDTESKGYAILSGSEAEFYIRPLNTCIGDTDKLECSADELACIEDFPVLPSDMTGLADTIKYCKIESYHRYPGFVRLRVLGEMNYNWKHKRYEFNQTIRTGLYLMNCMKDHETSNPNHDQFNRDLSKVESLPTIVSGPAIKTQRNHDLHLAHDSVPGLFCPQWPREAQDWPIRPRYEGWPIIDTISEVVQNGCHIVCAQHRSCRDDEFQWRLSFSVAEVILLQSWTKIQQIVYHLLRFFSKKVLIQKNCPKEDEVLCTYHLKTLMLWTCEEKPSEWWNSSSVIAICSELLQKLSDWLESRHCPNYFIPEANLFQEPLSSKKLHHTKRRLNAFHNAGLLSQWFLENYILPFIRSQLTFLKTKKVKPDFMDYMEPLLKYRKAFESSSLELLHFFKFYHSYRLCRSSLKHGFSSGLRLNLKLYQRIISVNLRMHNEMRFRPITEKMILCLIHHDNLLYILHIAYGLSHGEISFDSSLFVEFVKAMSMQPKIIRSQYHNFPKSYKVLSSRFQFQCAQDLMRNLTGSNYNSHPKFQLLSLLSEVFLRKAIKYDDCELNGIVAAALAYLAALHFTTLEYKQLIRLCSAVISNQTSEEEILNAGCLLFIDDIARIAGLCVLHQKITHTNLQYIGTRLYLDLRLSPKVFAHYLAMLSAERMSICFDLQHDMPCSVFPIDKYLKVSIKPKFITVMKLGTNFNVTKQIVYRRTDFLTTALNPILVKKTVMHVLMEYALENVTLFYSVIHREYGIRCNTAECYRASYLYKCRKYDETLHLCKRILCEPDLRIDLKQFSFMNILLIPPLDSFFDRDVQSLLGFHTLAYFLPPHNDDKRKFELTEDLTYDQWFASCVYLDRSELSIFLAHRYSIRCRYFLGRHFLARYLKVRCYIDSNLPFTETMTEFAALEAKLPFEHTIRRFLQQKLRIKKIPSCSMLNYAFVILDTDY